MIGTKIREQAMVYTHAPTEPAKGRTLLALPGQLAPRTDPPHARVQPERHQELRVGRVPPRHPFPRLDRRAKSRQVQMFYHLCHPPHRMRRRHQIIRTLHHHGHLPTLRLAQANRPRAFPRRPPVGFALRVHAQFKIISVINVLHMRILIHINNRRQQIRHGSSLPPLLPSSPIAPSPRP